jgi:cytochrome c-type biogenesis protein CcmH/NrfG
MARKRQLRQPPPHGEPKRSGSSILIIGFAVVMAAFLIIGGLAAALPWFFAEDSSQPSPGQAPISDEPTEEDLLRAQLEDDPEDVGSMILLAELLANTGRSDEAIRWYERAVERRPDQVTLRIAFGSVLMRQRFDLDAELQFQRALEIDPEDEQALFLLGQLYEQSTPPRQEEAEEMYRRVIETSPESFFAELARDALAGSDGQETEE